MATSNIIPKKSGNQAPQLHLGHILEMEAFGRISEYPEVTRAQVMRLIGRGGNS